MAVGDETPFVLRGGKRWHAIKGFGRTMCGLSMSAQQGYFKYGRELTGAFVKCKRCIKALEVEG